MPALNRKPLRTALSPVHVKPASPIAEPAYYFPPVLAPCPRCKKWNVDDPEVGSWCHACFCDDPADVYCNGTLVTECDYCGERQRCDLLGPDGGVIALCMDRAACRTRSGYEDLSATDQTLEA